MMREPASICGVRVLRGNAPSYLGSIQIRATDLNHVLIGGMFFTLIDARWFNYHLGRSGLYWKIPLKRVSIYEQ